MIAKSWVKKQVFSLNIAQIKKSLGRDRLKFSKEEIVDYLMALSYQQQQYCYFKAIWNKNEKISYQGFMKNLKVIAPLWGVLEKLHKEQSSISFDDLTIIDTSLLPCKEEKSISPKDWEKKRVTIRTNTTSKIYICGEKWLAVINSQKQIVFNQLLNINYSDQNILKNPYMLVSQGLRQGVLLADRGFSNKNVRKGFAFLNHEKINCSVRLVSPFHYKEKTTLTPEERLLYKKRWQIEEMFRQIKCPLGAFKLILKGSRNKKMLKAKVAIATLAWNMAHS